MQLTQPTASTSAESEQRPLMTALGGTDFGQGLQRSGIRIYGAIEGSYEYNANHRPFYTDFSGGKRHQLQSTVLNVGRSFDLYEYDKGYLNQLTLNVERAIKPSPAKWDIGGRLQVLYGSDARFTVSNGLFNHQTANLYTIGKYGRPDEELALDIPRAYLDVSAPVGNGLRLRVGRFTFFKTIDPEERVFYTETFAYHQSFPYTLTGGTLLYPLSDTVRIEGGISRGWDQSLADNNGMIDGFGRISWDVTPSSLLTASFITGPELPKNKSHETTVIDITYAATLSDRFSVLFDGVYGHGAPAPAITSVFTGDGEGSKSFSDDNIPGHKAPDADDYDYPGVTANHANWYGISGDAIYKINDFVSVAGRLEWFRDESGALSKFRFTRPTSEGIKPPPNGGENLYGATFGLTITPLATTPVGTNFKLRPEFRYDYASDRLFGSFTRHDQITLSIDALLTF